MPDSERAMHVLMTLHSQRTTTKLLKCIYTHMHLYIHVQVPVYIYYACPKVTLKNVAAVNYIF